MLVERKDRLGTFAEGVSPQHVALEILESALPDALQLEAFCQTARELGYLLALDDMGTGHSSSSCTGCDGAMPGTAQGLALA
jgi:EAL domain-containing protein (putative c-di-GMP-specific phosphodiesterase class I)